MVRRRVGAPTSIGGDISQYNDPDVLRSLLNLADIESLANTEAPPAPTDLMGTSQDPKNFADVAGVQEFEDIRAQPQPDDYLNTLKRISNLPLAMSDNDELRQDALENLQSYDEPEPAAEAPRKYDSSNPNDVISQLASLPASLRDDDSFRDDYLQDMQDKGRNVEVEAGSLPRNAQGQLKDPLEHIRSMVEADQSLMDELPEETRAMLQQNEPNPEKAFNQPELTPIAEAKIIPPGQPVTAQDVEQYPEQTVKEGAVEQAMQDPTILEDLAKLNGMKEIPEEYLAKANEWQNALTKRQDQLTAEEQSLLNKAEMGEFSTLDKIILGIAVAIPILMAIRYGAGAGLASAGEGLKGFASGLQQEQKSVNDKNTKAQERMGDIQKERLQLGEKDIEVNKKLLDSIPDKSARDFLKGKKIKQIGDKIGISIGDEKGALWLDANQLETSDEGVTQAKKYMDEAKHTVGLLNKAGRVIDEVSDLLNAAPDDIGMWDALKSNWGWFTSAGGNNPFGGKPLMIDVQDKDGKVRKVNFFEALKQKTTALQDVYNKVNLARAALTSNVLEHWAGILGDPKDMGEWMTGQSIQTVRDKTASLKDFLNEGATEVMIGNGFLREPLERAYPGNQMQPLESEDSVVRKIRENPEAYRSKVK